MDRNPRAAGYRVAMTAPPDDRAKVLSQRVMEAQVRLAESMLHLADSVTRLQATRQEIAAGRTERAVLHDSAFARLQARLATLPVIEQAKGIIMAQTGCSPDEAFGLLRKASQRGNVPVRELAAGIVRQAGGRGPAPAPARGQVRRG